jgi:branched-chain amino acid transport system permease protein
VNQETGAGTALPRTAQGHAARRLAETAWSPAVLSATLAGIALAVNGFGSETLVFVTTQMLINVTFVIGLYIFSGNSGVLQFGHIGIAGVAGYATALLTIPIALKASQFTNPSPPSFLRWINHVELGTLSGTLAAAGVATIFAVLLTVPLMRLSGAQAGIATFAVLVIVNVFFAQADSITRGFTTIFGVPQTTTIFSALTWAVIAIVIAYAYHYSKRGVLLRASREDIIAARSVGVHVARERGVAFVLGAFFLGVGGALYVHTFSTIGPNDFYLDLTFLTVAMLVIGGTRSIAGAVTGVIFVTVISELLRRVELNGLGPIKPGSLPGLTNVVLGITLIATLILRQEGIVGNRELSLPRFTRALRRLPRQSGSSAAEMDANKPVDRPTE